MSTGAQVAVLDARGVRETRARSDLLAAERPLVRLLAFAGLAVYGALRWGALLNPAPVWRLLALVALAIVIAGPGEALRARSRPLAAAVAVVAIIAIFPLAGLPFSWIRHVRIAVTADAIGEGLSSLPRALVPYSGINEWVRVVIVLGAGVLLIDAALMLAFAPRPISELRRAAAALPLVVLAVVPSTLARPSLSYLHGLLLFALLAAFVWGERVPRYDVPLAIGLAALAGVAAMIAAPALDEHSPWLNYEALAGTLAPGHVESFDWSQRYGPLNWPRTGREVLDVQARHPEYWKAEDLDLFTGTGWSQGYAQPSAQAPPAPDASALRRWTQTITVTLRAMRTTNVIAAGYAAQPDHLPYTVVPGEGDGTWVVGADLEPGDSYTAQTYSPNPLPAQLDAASFTPQEALELAGFRSILLPPGQGALSSPEIAFPPFHSHLPVQSITGIDVNDGTALVRSSPYGPAYELAQRLARRAATPYRFVENVLHYLGRGYTYSEDPPPSPYPIESFLFNDKIGYCQQFAGAMALLLRMGGVPARVAAGFTTGTFDDATHRYVVTDIDAHAWVEVWFPKYGWVRFDPTPASAPARGGHVSLAPLHGSTANATPVAPVRRPEPTPDAAAARVPVHAGGTSAWLIAVLIAIPIALVALLLRVTTRLRQPSQDELLAELERALARSGRPLAAGVTLARLEHRFRSSEEAAEYIRALRMMRFGGAAQLPTAAQRRALRTQLRAGLGIFGRLRALWALPPRWTPAWSTSSRGIHSER